MKNKHKAIAWALRILAVAATVGLPFAVVYTMRVHFFMANSLPAALPPMVMPEMSAVMTMEKRMFS